MQITCQWYRKKIIAKKLVISLTYSAALFYDMALAVVISVNIQVVFDIIQKKIYKVGPDLY